MNLKVSNDYRNIDAYVNTKLNFAYIRVCKAGCSSILNSIFPTFDVPYRKDFIHIDLAEIRKKHIQLNNLMFLERNPDYETVKNVLFSKKYYRFTCLRDPVSRFMSGFFNQIVDVIPSGYYSYSLPFCKPFIDKIDGDNIEQIFVEFLNYVQRIDDSQRDTHFKTQQKVTMIGHIPYNKIFNLESLSEDFNELIELYPEFTKIEILNKSTDNVLKDYLAEKYKKQISEIYRCDYELLKNLKL